MAFENYGLSVHNGSCDSEWTMSSNALFIQRLDCCLTYRRLFLQFVNITFTLLCLSLTEINTVQLTDSDYHGRRKDQSVYYIRREVVTDLVPSSLCNCQVILDNAHGVRMTRLQNLFRQISYIVQV